VTSVKVFGYTDKISARPGEAVQFHVSAEGTDRVEAQFVRLIHGDQNPAGPGFVEEEIDCVANGSWRVEKQFTQVGAFLEVDDGERRLAFEGSFTLFAFIHPTWPASGERQTVMGRWDSSRSNGYGLGLNEKGVLQFWIGRGSETFECVAADVPLQVQMWYFVAATFDASTRRATLYQVGVANRYNGLLGKVALVDYDSCTSSIFRTMPGNLGGTPFLMAGSRGRDALQAECVSELYWGKIDRCGTFDQALQHCELDAIRSGPVPATRSLVAYWDTSKGYTERGIGDVVVDVGRHGLNARGYNRPVRGQTGWNWNGFTDCFRLAPDEFGGIEFHGDALTDCNWKPSKVVTLPYGLKSGCYAMRLRSDGGNGSGEDHVVFFVRPEKPRARIALLFPTMSYLAIANERLSFDHPEREAVTGQPAVLSDIDIEMYARADFGLSTYDVHADGNGVC